MLRSECDDSVGNQVESVRFNYPLIIYIGKCCNYIYNRNIFNKTKLCLASEKKTIDIFRSLCVTIIVIKKKIII